MINEGIAGTSTLEVKGAAFSRLILFLSMTAATVREPVSVARAWSTVLEERAPGCERGAGVVGNVGAAMNFEVVQDNVVWTKLHSDATKSP
jgi:hypothetical protein